MRIAVIAAAGWKGSGCKTEPPPMTPDVCLPLAGCPEPLLPLGDGSTVLSRLSSQLKDLGYELYIGVGAPGCLYPFRVADRLQWGGEGFLTPEAIDWGRKLSPWNQERVDYCKEFGTVVEITQPEKGSKHSGFLEIADSIQEPWSRIMLMAGDYVFTDRLIGEIDAYGLCVFLLARSEVLIFNQRGLGMYRRIVTQSAELNNCHYPAWSDLESLRPAFESIGIPYYDMHTEYPRERWNDWTDIDFPADIRFSTYPQALEWMREKGART